MSPSNTRIVIGPNASLDVRGAVWFLGSLSAVALAVAVAAVSLGFWPVLPFAGAELVAVTAAVWVCLKRNRYREVITVGEDKISIEFGLAGIGPATQIEWHRAWTRVWLEAGVHGNAPSRLVLGSSGQRITVGRCLTDEERDRLLARLRHLLSARPALGRSTATGPGF